MSDAQFTEISPADFFYRNRDIAGFTNPVRSTYMAVRELLENSLDSGEEVGILPDIYVKMNIIRREGEREIIELTVSDNGRGIPPDMIPSAFGQVLFGSKYVLKQSRGTFGLGGKMAYLYGQITTNEPLKIVAGDGTRASEFRLMIDISENKPKVFSRRDFKLRRKWRGVQVSFLFEGNYVRAAPKIIDYFSQTAMVAPYANLTFVDPNGQLYRFTRSTTKMPKPPKVTRPHPHGLDVEMLGRMIATTKRKDLISFLSGQFERVGKKTAKKFMKTFSIGNAKLKNLTHKDIVTLARSLVSYPDFLPPDPSSLSPLGEELFKEGIEKELSPEFTSVETRKPSAYSGHPFIVEVAIAYGGGIPTGSGMSLYRFANRIPLLYDESADVSWKVVHEQMNWRRYGVSPDSDPVAVFVHICSTKIPYKTVGKEYIADRPEIEREILNGMRNVARDLSVYLSRRRRIGIQKKRVNMFEKYLPIIVEYATKAAKTKDVPDVRPLLRKAKRGLTEEETGVA